MKNKLRRILKAKRKVRRALDHARTMVDGRDDPLVVLERSVL